MKTIDPRITDERLPEWKPAECVSGRGVTRVLRVSRGNEIGYSLVYEHMDLSRDVLGPVTDVRMSYDWYDAVRAESSDQRTLKVGRYKESRRGIYWM